MTVDVVASARPSTARATRALLLALAVSLLVAACGGPPAGAGAGGTAPADPEGVGGSTVEQVIDALAASGIRVFEEGGSATPVREVGRPLSPFALLLFQVENMAADARAGGGIGADQLDDLVPMPDDTVPFSFVLAGYAATAQTPGGRVAAELLADQDLTRPADLLFPTIVIALFVGEVTAAAAEAGDTALGRRAGHVAAAGPGGLTGLADAVQAGASDPCGDFSRFFAGVLEAVADAILSIVPSIPFLEAAIRWALSEGLRLAEDAVKELVGRIPFLTAIKSAVGVLALAVTVVAALRIWTVPLVGTPSRAHYSVGSTVNRVVLTGTVDDGPGDIWPQAVRSCAALVGIELPRGGAVGSEVEWRIVEGARHTAPGIEYDTKVGEDRRIRYAFDTANEPQRDHDAGRLANGAVRLRATVKRQDVEQLREFITKAITDALPAGIYEALVGYFGDPLGKIAALTDVTSQGLVVAEFHVEPEPSPSPSPSPDASPSPDRRSEFCTRYRALLTWWQTQEGAANELSRAWAAEIVARSVDMRSYAPAELVPWVDLVIRTYRTYAEVADPLNVPLSGPEAAGLLDAALAMDAYCEVRRGVEYP